MSSSIIFLVLPYLAISDFQSIHSISHTSPIRRIEKKQILYQYVSRSFNLEQSRPIEKYFHKSPDKENHSCFPLWPSIQYLATPTTSPPDHPVYQLHWRWRSRCESCRNGDTQEHALINNGFRLTAMTVILATILMESMQFRSLIKDWKKFLKKLVSVWLFPFHLNPIWNKIFWWIWHIKIGFYNSP